MARVRSEPATPLIPRDAESVNTFTGRERRCSFGAGILSNRRKNEPLPKPLKPLFRPRNADKPRKRAKKAELRSLNSPNDKSIMNEFQAPQIENLQEITPEQAAEYVRFVAELRHQQRRWFNLHNHDALNTARQMEKELDALNAHLLDPNPRLF